MTSRSKALAWERACIKSSALSKKMRSRYQIINNSGVYFITSTIIEWIPVFTKREYFDIIVQSLSYSSARNYSTGDGYIEI